LILLKQRPDGLQSIGSLYLWIASDFSNANFRVRVIDVGSNTARDFYLDWIAVNVTYQP